MKIIREDEPGIFAILPLLVSWGVKRCNVEHCKRRPNTIITGASKEYPLIGMCEKHYQAGKKAGRLLYRFVFDSFDAFKSLRPKEEAV